MITGESTTRSMFVLSFGSLFAFIAVIISYFGTSDYRIITIIFFIFASTLCFYKFCIPWNAKGSITENEITWSDNNKTQSIKKEEIKDIIFDLRGESSEMVIRIKGKRITISEPLCYFGDLNKAIKFLKENEYKVIKK